jgi:hypothetical protein
LGDLKLKQISERIFIGSELDHRNGDDEWAIVHACKSPCHQLAVGYRGSLPTSHPNYLVLEEAGDLYLNMIDPPGPLFMPPLFTSFLEFAARQWEQGKKILIHCNQGESRAPSLGLLLLAKYKGEISDESYEKARGEFQMLYPFYQPGNGLQIYLTSHWHEF